MADRSEHTIWVVMRTRSSAVVPVCWRHTQEDAEAVRQKLMDANAVRDAEALKQLNDTHHYTYFFVLPVTDSIQEFDE